MAIKFIRPITACLLDQRHHIHLDRPPLFFPEYGEEDRQMLPVREVGLLVNKRLKMMQRIVYKTAM